MQSVINQTYPNIEIIVVDDASTDDTRERLSVFSDSIHYILVSHQGKSGGPSRTRNVGIEASTGEYLAFLDSDDEWLPDKLTKQVAVLENPFIHIVYCDAYYIDEDDNVIRLQRERHRGNILPQLLGGNVISGSASAVMLRRSCFAKLSPFRTDLLVREDWDMWLRLAFYFNFDFVPEPLVRIRLHARNTSNSRSAGLWIHSIVEIYTGLFTDPATREYTLRHWRVCQSTISHLKGDVLYDNGDVSAARCEYLKSIRYTPIQTRSYIGLMKTLLGKQAVSVLKKMGLQLRRLLSLR